MINDRSGWYAMLQRNIQPDFIINHAGIHITVQITLYIFVTIISVLFVYNLIKPFFSFMYVQNGQTVYQYIFVFYTKAENRMPVPLNRCDTDAHLRTVARFPFPLLCQMQQKTPARLK